MNPHEKGSIEYLDWATAQHDKAIAPKKKKKKMMGPKKSIATEGLAGSNTSAAREKRLMSFMDDKFTQQKNIQKIIKQ